MCRDSYKHFIGISDSSLNRIIATAKRGGKSGKIFSDTTPVHESPNDIKSFLKDCYGISIDDKQASFSNLPSRSQKSKALFNWLEKFITLASCINPTDAKFQI